MKGFTTQAICTRVSSLADGGLSIGFHTNELNHEEKVVVMEMLSQAGWLVFKPNEVQDSEIPSYDTENDTKTPSKRLRGVLYKLWKLSEEGDFDSFYKTKMEQVINHFKNKLD